MSPGIGGSRLEEHRLGFSMAKNDQAAVKKYVKHVPQGWRSTFGRVVSPVKKKKKKKKKRALMDWLRTCKRYFIDLQRISRL